MVSQLKVNEIIKQSGSSITIGEAGDTVSGPFTNVPAFEAYSTANQDVSDNTYTKVQFPTEAFDTDSCYDNSTNYRFTPNIAGKYFVYASVQALTDTSQLQFTQVSIYKNGSMYNQRMIDFRVNNGHQVSNNISAVINMNGSSDYLEIYGKVFKGGGTITKFQGDNASDKSIQFGAYRIVGA